MSEKRILVTASQYKVFVPFGHKWTMNREKSFERFCKELSSTFGQDVRSIFINENENDPREIDNIVIKFNLDNYFEDNGTPNRFEE